MEKRTKLVKSNYTLINKTKINNYKTKTGKEKIQELIVQNEETIKKYEQIKEETNDPKKKDECIQIISKYRNQQVKLHNKLYSLNLFLDMYMNNSKNNVPRPKPRYGLNNSLYLKQYFHHKVNSTIKPSSNYSNIYTDHNNNKNFTLKKNQDKTQHRKCISNLSSVLENTSNIILKNPVKKINVINNKRNHIYPNKLNKNSNSKNSYLQLFLNTSIQSRPNSNYGLNSTLTTCTSSKIDNRNKYIAQPIKENNKFFNSKKNIFIINNINNYYGKIKNSSTTTISKYIQNIPNHIVNKNLRKKIKNKILKYNILDEDEQLDININIENEEKKNNKKNLDIIDDNIEFKTNPKLIVKQKSYKIKNNSIVELYYSYHNNNELYMAMSEKNILGYNIKIIKFKKKQFITRLKKHNNRIITIKHFFNMKKIHDYLISGDIDHVVNVWDVSYKYSVNQFIYSIIYNGKSIYNVLQISIEENENYVENYLIIYDESINIYELNEGNFIKNVNHYPSHKEKILNLINWKNKDNNLDYIIKCTEHKIVIFNFIDEDIFFELCNYYTNNNNGKFAYKTEGCIISNKNLDYLCIFSSEMNLEIWDLYNLCLKDKISIDLNLINNTYYLSIIPWNYQYILIINSNNTYIYIININTGISSKILVNFRNNNKKVYIKKLLIKKYGESLLFWCPNRYMSLFSPNNI